MGSREGRKVGRLVDWQGSRGGWTGVCKRDWEAKGVKEILGSVNVKGKCG